MKKDIEDIICKQIRSGMELYQYPHNIIFLDIDGVLNSQQYAEKEKDKIVGIDKSKVKILSDIVVENNAKVILTSTWKNHWYIDKIDSKQSELLVRSLSKYNIFIAGKISDDISTDKRGKAILNWLDNHIHKNFAIIDDDVFDYREIKIDNHLIKTNFYLDGLLESDIEKARKILNNEGDINE